MTSPFSNPTLRVAIEEIESLGVQVSAQDSPGAVRYAILTGRSNARWWLVPLTSKQVAGSGLALFQPLLPSARIMKAAANVLARCGLNRLWARQVIYITGESCLAHHFPQEQTLSFAYFTGTDSPHRKVAVQIMDARGNIKGFAKVTRNPFVAPLLEQEAAALTRVGNLDWQAAYVPSLLFCGEHNGSSVLITDTLKAPATPSATRFSPAHWAFVKELEQKTSIGEPLYVGELAQKFRERYDRVCRRLETAWQARMNDAVRYLEAHARLPINGSLSHGDFTPWNTFVLNGRLYVFDWEYAEDAMPSSNDVIHFTLNEPGMSGLSASEKIEIISARLSCELANAGVSISLLLVIYLLSQSLRRIERVTENHNLISAWDGESESAALFDRLINFSVVAR